MGAFAGSTKFDLNVYRQRSMTRKQQLLQRQSVLRESSLNKGEKLVSRSKTRHIHLSELLSNLQNAVSVWPISHLYTQMSQPDPASIE